MDHIIGHKIIILWEFNMDGQNANAVTGGRNDQIESKVHRFSQFVHIMRAKSQLKALASNGKIFHEDKIYIFVSHESVNQSKVCSN